MHVLQHSENQNLFDTPSFSHQSSHILTEYRFLKLAGEPLHTFDEVLFLPSGSGQLVHLQYIFSCTFLTLYYLDNSYWYIMKTLEAWQSL